MESKQGDQSGSREKGVHDTSKAAGSLHLDLVYHFLFLPEHQDKNLVLEREFARKCKRLILASLKI